MAFGLGSVPVVGGLYTALKGQNNYRAHTPSMAAGQKALTQQLQAQHDRNVGAQYSLASSARGSSAPMALRAAQMNAANAGAQMNQQAAIGSNQLAQAQMNQEMQAQQINADIYQKNASGMGQLAGAAVGAGAGLMLMSDERTKMPFSTTGYQSALAAGGDDGRRVQWVNSPSGPSEQERIAAHAQQAGVALTPQDWTAMGYAAPGQAQQPLARPQQQQGGGLGQNLLMGGLSQLSDQRAKVLADENKALKDALGSLRGALEAQQQPRPAMMAGGLGARSGRVTAALQRVPRDREMTPAEQKELDWAIEDATLKGNPLNNGQVTALGTGQPGVAEIPAPVMQRNMQRAEQRVALPPTIDSDEDAKEGTEGMGRMEFPEGIKPVAFEYKPGMGDGGGKPHVGVLAQDVEESPEGATVVDEGPDGMKRLDIGGLTALNTAKLSELEKRLRAVEGK